MHQRKKRLLIIIFALCVVSVAVALIAYALQSNIALYILPSDVLAGKAPQDKLFRIGGMVKEGSVQRQADGVSISFSISDGVKEVPVTYKGILPDLFKEGKGVVAQGKLVNSPQLNFIASEVLAKHDENYMPPEAAAAMMEAKKRQGANAKEASSISNSQTSTTVSVTK